MCCRKSHQGAPPTGTSSPPWPRPLSEQPCTTRRPHRTRSPSSRRKTTGPQATSRSHDGRVTTTTASAPPRYRNTLWSREHRIPTIGLVLVVTLVAFEFMGVATALPTLVADLHGGRLYAWAIAAFTAASAVGTVVGGRISDRRGPGGPMIGAIVLFAIGLLIGGSAHSMALLLAGR